LVQADDGNIPNSPRSGQPEPCDQFAAIRWGGWTPLLVSELFRHCCGLALPLFPGS